MIWAIEVIANPGGVGKKLNSVTSFLSGLACKIKGSAHPHLVEAVNKIGFQGYTRTHSGGTAYFTPEGTLFLDQSELYKWYIANILPKMQGTGIDPCFLKIKPTDYPPSEIFRPATDGKPYVGYDIVEFSKIKIRVDKHGYNSTVINAQAIAGQLQDAGLAADEANRTGVSQAGLGSFVPMAIIILVIGMVTGLIKFKGK